MSEVARLPRPRLCPEPRRCTPLFQVGEIRSKDAGESWSCFGEMKGTVTFSYDGNVHENDCRSCHYTPLKGLIAFQETEDDWAALSRAYKSAFRKLLEMRAARKHYGPIPDAWKTASAKEGQ